MDDEWGDAFDEMTLEEQAQFLKGIMMMGMVYAIVKNGKGFSEATQSLRGIHGNSSDEMAAGTEIRPTGYLRGYMVRVTTWKARRANSLRGNGRFRGMASRGILRGMRRKNHR